MDCRPIGDWPTSAKRGRFKFRFSSSTLVMSTDARHVVMSLTHSNGKRGTADNSQSRGLVQTER